MIKTVLMQVPSLAAHHGPTVLDGLVILSLVILLWVLLLRRLSQPYFIAYILSGMVLGPDGLQLLVNPHLITQLGELGIILLLFFIGLEIRLPDLTKHIAKPLLGMLVQLLLSVAAVWLLGFYLQWSLAVKVLISFALSLSSSAIIMPYLRQNGEIMSPLGTLTTGVLLLQDMLTVPMLVTLNLLGQAQFNPLDIGLMLGGGLLILLFLRLAMGSRTLTLPFAHTLAHDHDLQVFWGLLTCFGMAWLTQTFHLSAALGAFVAGVLVNRSGATHWLEQSLHPFRVFFLALFFVAIGLQIEVGFLVEHWSLISGLVWLVLLINSLLGALAFRLVGSSWRDSVYAGALLSQLGEFSIVLSLSARQLGLINDFIYQLTLSVVALTMLITTLWIGIIRTFVFRSQSAGITPNRKVKE
ncbi:cation:proton antiporter domain-containing protein [Spirosoma harenae]